MNARNLEPNAMDGARIHFAFLGAVFTIFHVSCAGVTNPERPSPAGPDEGTYVTAEDGTRLFVFTHPPPGTPASTVYVLAGITGINHRAEADVIELLGAGKNRVVVIHPRGTGYSEGTRGDTRDFALCIKDYGDAIRRDIAARPAGERRFLFGHSMSTAMALAVENELGAFDGVILVNPPFELKASPGMSPTLAEYIKYAWYFVFFPHTPVVNMAGNPEDIRDEAERREAEQRGNDPLLVRFFSMYVMNESRKLMEKMGMFAQNVSSPLLLVYGAKDSLVERHGCDELYALWRHADKELVVVADGPHGKLTVLKAAERIVRWMASK